VLIIVISIIDIGTGILQMVVQNVKMMRKKKKNKLKKIMNYDNWKQKTPDEDEIEGECAHCGVPCNKAYCSEACKKYDTQ
jgi:hypothetical protein